MAEGTDIFNILEKPRPVVTHPAPVCALDAVFGKPTFLQPSGFKSRSRVHILGPSTSWLSDAVNEFPALSVLSVLTCKRQNCPDRMGLWPGLHGTGVEGIRWDIASEVTMTPPCHSFP